MGFGEVVYEQDALVDKIIEYMENGCVMPEIYKARVDDFFAFHDRNNSQRVYDELIKLPTRKGVSD
jgi:CDP-glycerol glycerophosphotransferase (TagB/SpsB family)